MRIRWYGQSAFLLTGEQHRVFIDPFGDVASASPLSWSYRLTEHESPIGEVVRIASEHDAVAGTQRGANTIFRFALDLATLRPLIRDSALELAREALRAIGLALTRLQGQPGEEAARLASAPECPLSLWLHTRRAGVIGSLTSLPSKPRSSVSGGGTSGSLVRRRLAVRDLVGGEVGLQ